MQMDKKNRKRFMEILLALGIVGVGYGIAEKNNPVFIIGLLIGIAAYLLIRKELKASIKEKS